MREENQGGYPSQGMAYARGKVGRMREGRQGVCARQGVYARVGRAYA
jgi:hypothetical protein